MFLGVICFQLTSDKLDRAKYQSHLNTLYRQMNVERIGKNMMSLKQVADKPHVLSDIIATFFIKTPGQSP